MTGLGGCDSFTVKLTLMNAKLQGILTVFFTVNQLFIGVS
ncbi:MAG: hypothetical protein JWQ85_495 [Mucilaginibacter sp.]|nr:hypothetical protein [Mucilaginibacter sp.]